MAATVAVFFTTSFFLLFLALIEGRAEVCRKTSCRIGFKPEIRFPFRLSDSQPARCGYKGFDLSCNEHNQTIVNLPFSGEFTVTKIDYEEQLISVDDPNGCLPKRILNFSLSNTPFRAIYDVQYMFINCSSDNTSPVVRKIVCLSNENHTVYVTPPGPIAASCHKIATVPIPTWCLDCEYNVGVELAWDVPTCRTCESRGGSCGFKSDTGVETACYGVSRRSANGLPRSAKYGIILGAGIPGVLCLIGLASFVCGRVRAYGRRRNPNLDFSSAMPIQAATTIEMGLDRPTIESYPKTVLGESRRLPTPNEGPCSICLAEYQPKDTLRTITDCNHYFHAHCIDEWLSRNATCPVCRNMPDGLSTTTSCSSVSSSSSSSLSFHGTSH